MKYASSLERYYNNNPVIDIDFARKITFGNLCEILDMDFVLDKNTYYFVGKDRNGNNVVFESKADHTLKIDDRGDLFVALRNVAIQLFPNLSFKTDKTEDRSDVREVGIAGIKTPFF